MTFPFPIFSGGDLGPPSNITVGTSFGDISGNGGYAAAFDGTTSQNNAASAAGGNAGYLGKDLGTAALIDSIKVWPSNNFGYSLVGGVDSGVTITIQVYGKNSLPASGTDGTLIGTTSFSDTTSGPTTITSTDTLTPYQYVWIRITGSSALSHSYVAELQIFGNIL